METKTPPTESQTSVVTQDESALAGVRNTLAYSRARLLWMLCAAGWGVLLTLGLLVLIEQAIGVSHGPTDFCQDYIAAQRLAHGAPIYTPLRCWAGFLYVPGPVEYDAHPPSSVLLFVPFLLFSRVPATLLWALGSLASYLASGVLLLREMGWRSLRALTLFVLGSVLWQPVTLAGNVQNLAQVLLVLLVGAWILERKGYDSRAGALIGLAGLLKIWPAMLLLGALLQRRWWAAAVGGLILVGGTLLSLAMLGPAAYAAYLGSVQTNEHYWVPSGGSFSLVSAIARPFTGFADPSFPIPAVLHGLNLTQAVMLGEVVAGSLLLATLSFIAWYNRGDRCEAVGLLSQSLLITVLLLTFPLTLFWGLITLLLPGAMLLLALRQLPKPPRWWFVLLGFSLLPLLVPAWAVTFPKWLLNWNAGLGGLVTILVGLSTFALLLFAGSQAWLLWQVGHAERKQGIPYAVSLEE